MRQITETVKQLIIINILFFVGTIYVGDIAYKLLSLYFPENSLFMGWQLITYMFMHGNIWHILFNMFGLYMFGSTLEIHWGARKFLFFYISCGVGAAALHIGMSYYEFNRSVEILTQNGDSYEHVVSLLNQGKQDLSWNRLLTALDFQSLVGTFVTPAVGASGSIFGILVAFAYTFPNAELMLFPLPIPIKAKYFVSVFVGIELISGFTGLSLLGQGNVAHFAHVGGALTGFIISWYWGKNQFNNNRWY